MNNNDVSNVSNESDVSDVTDVSRGSNSHHLHFGVLSDVSWKHISVKRFGVTYTTYTTFIDIVQTRSTLPPIRKINALNGLLGLFSRYSISLHKCEAPYSKCLCGFFATQTLTIFQKMTFQGEK